jgi:hypothetical protein
MNRPDIHKLNLPDSLDYQTVTLLEKLRMSLQVALTEEALLNDPLVNMEWVSISRHVILNISGYIWSEKLGVDTVRWPADWWQAFKERWYPAWAKRRWPVRYNTHTVDIRAAYPTLRPSLPQYPFRYQVTDE